HLRGRPIVLLVYNCEQVVEDCARLVDTILASSSTVTMLTTSREPLHVHGETVWRMRSLTIPDPESWTDVDRFTQSEAVQLFLDRAQLVTTAFQLSPENIRAVGEICSGLDGIPLGIELAASRTGLMTPDQIRSRLLARFDTL